MIDGLAFLPVQKVIEGMKYLKSICAPDNTDIIDYFDSTSQSVSSFRLYRKLETCETILLTVNKICCNFTVPTFIKDSDYNSFKSIDLKNDSCFCVILYYMQ
ncbi:hypothetical protein ACI65C_012522 [Semiaphis heraclei]